MRVSASAGLSRSESGGLPCGWSGGVGAGGDLAIADLRQTTLMSPSQWEGTLVDGRPLHIRYRWGELSVRVGRHGGAIDPALDGSLRFQGYFGEPTSPLIELPEVLLAKGISMAGRMGAAH